MADDFDDLEPTLLEPAPVGARNQGTHKTTTEAPTSGVTKTAEQIANIAKLRRENTLTEAGLDFVTLINQHFNIAGSIPTADKAFEEYGIPIDDFSKFLVDPAVVRALQERGIDVKPPTTEAVKPWQQYSLTPTQLIVADAMLDTLDGRSYKKRLQDLGVSTKQWQSWLKQASFVKYLAENTDVVLKNAKHEANLALVEKVQRGDMNAIKFYYEMMGWFTPATASGTSSGPSGADVTRIVTSIIEIIQEEVNDRETAARIAERLKNLMTANATANALVNPAGYNSGVDRSTVHEVRTPQVIPNRVLE